MGCTTTTTTAFLLTNCQIYGCARIVQHTERAPCTIPAHRDHRAGAERRRTDWALCFLSLAQSARRRSAPASARPAPDSPRDPPEARLEAQEGSQLCFQILSYEMHRTSRATVSSNGFMPHVDEGLANANAQFRTWCGCSLA